MFQYPGQFVGRTGVDETGVEEQWYGTGTKGGPTIVLGSRDVRENTKGLGTGVETSTLSGKYLRGVQ